MAFSTLNCDYAQQVQAAIQSLDFTVTHHNDLNHFTSPEVDSLWPQKTAEIFMGWRTNDNAPSMVDIGLQFIHETGEHPLFPALITACLLADIPHDNPYHDNHHFREMMCVCIKFITVHNNSHPQMALDVGDKLILLIAAAIHDFAHDGASNMVEAEHIPSRLEKISIAKIKPFFDALDVSNDVFAKIERMVLSTDTSHSDNGRSPVGITRDIFLAHEHDNVSIVNAPDDYAMLLESKKLSLMSMMLCEADIVMSSALSYDFSKEMTRHVAAEIGLPHADAHVLYGFMQKICRGGFITRPAQLLLSKSFRSIMLQASIDLEKDVLYA